MTTPASSKFGVQASAAAAKAQDEGPQVPKLLDLSAIPGFVVINKVRRGHNDEEPQSS